MANVTANATTDSKFSCEICSEEFLSTTDKTVCTIPCGHVYHETCLKTWFHTQREQSNRTTCPNCRRETTFNQIIRLFGLGSNSRDENSNVPVNDAENAITNRPTIRSTGTSTNFLSDGSVSSSSISIHDSDSGDDAEIIFSDFNTTVSDSHSEPDSVSNDVVEIDSIDDHESIDEYEDVFDTASDPVFDVSNDNSDVEFNDVQSNSYDSNDSNYGCDDAPDIDYDDNGASEYDGGDDNAVSDVEINPNLSNDSNDVCDDASDVEYDDNDASNNDDAPDIDYDDNDASDYDGGDDNDYDDYSDDDY